MYAAPRKKPMFKYVVNEAKTILVWANTFGLWETGNYTIIKKELKMHGVVFRQGA